MNRWLEGFAYHVHLTVWTFGAAGVAAAGTAGLTVGMQAYLAARAKPILALRYE